MALKPSVFKKFQTVVGKENALRDAEDRLCYAYDATAGCHMPDVVLFPKDAKEISEILKIANADRVYVTPRGAGSGLSGGSLAVNGGIVMAMSRLNRILDIDTDNLVAHVEPGVVTGDFHAEVERKGLFYPPDPASSGFSTLGGNLAECAGGPRAVKYGVTRDYVLGLEAVLPTGEILHTGVQTAKGVVGYDLTRLLVGSEGTLGIITKMILRLLPLPKAVGTMIAVFADMETAAVTVSRIIKSGTVPRTVEYMDQASILCVERYIKAGLPIDAGALLIIEVDGSLSQVDEDIARLRGLCLSQGALSVDIARNREEVANLWKARRSINPALFQLAPHKINEDIVVPRSRIPDVVRKIIALKNSSGLSIASYGHAGDGNIHVNIMLDKNVPGLLEKAETVVEELFDYTLSLGGTLSGEHGVGITKAPYIRKEIGSVELLLMKKIKAVFDPNGILNPGKIFP
jgi:glycolate oxidase